MGSQIIRKDDSGRKRMAPASSPGRVRSRAAAHNGATGEAESDRSPWGAPVLHAGSLDEVARITAREAMSASSIDRSGKRWKNANPPSNGNAATNPEKIGCQRHEFTF